MANWFIDRNDLAYIGTRKSLLAMDFQKSVLKSDSYFMMCNNYYIKLGDE